MKRTLTTIICTVMLAAAFTLTASAEDTAQITTTGEEVMIEMTGSAEEAEPEDTAQTEEEADSGVSEIVQIEDGGESEKTNRIDPETMTEEDMREVIIRVAEAVGAYEDEVPAAGKVKQWIFDNLATIAGFAVALAALIATPVGRNIFKRCVEIAKATMVSVKGWKEELEGVITRNGEKNAELRAAVNELMAKLTRENEEANKRAEAAEAALAESQSALLEAKREARETYERCAASCEAVCRAALVMAKPLETNLQRSKALDEMQKREILNEHSKNVAVINALLDGTNKDGEGEDVAD